MKQVIQKRLAVSGGSWITVDVFGDADAPGLVIVPGSMSDAHEWRNVASAITAWPSVAVVNRRGWPTCPRPRITSDFHFGHFNILRYCCRPFENVQAMDDAIADGVHACVKPNDVLYFLGDFCLGKAEQVTAYRKRLTCKTIHFIEGNHDKVARTQQHLFTSWSVLSEINVAKQKIVLSHYAMRVWPRHAQGAWHLYGHSHGNLVDDPRSLSMDVGLILMRFALGTLTNSKRR